MPVNEMEPCEARTALRSNVANTSLPPMDLTNYFNTGMRFLAVFVPSFALLWFLQIFPNSVYATCMTFAILFYGQNNASSTLLLKVLHLLSHLISTTPF